MSNSLGEGLAIAGNIVTTVARLPTATPAMLGRRGFVTDSDQTIIAGLGLPVSGGGSIGVPVYCDGTDWLIGG